MTKRTLVASARRAKGWCAVGMGDRYRQAFVRLRANRAPAPTVASDRRDGAVFRVGSVGSAGRRISHRFDRHFDRSSVAEAIGHFSTGFPPGFVSQNEGFRRMGDGPWLRSRPRSTRVERGRGVAAGLDVGAIGGGAIGGGAIAIVGEGERFRTRGEVRDRTRQRMGSQ